MTTDKTPATLATAKHGGCVQLGTSERERFEAFADERGLDTTKCSASGMKDHYDDLSTACCWDAWMCALSAQPSPSGQGDAWAIKLARESAFAHSSEHAYLPQTREEANNWQPHEWVIAAIQTAAHGAPKPEGQEPITVEAVAEIFNHPEYGLSINWLLENGIGELQVGDVLMVSNRAITDEDGAGEVYAAPPAQQPAQVYLDGLDRALGEAIDQRDRYHEVADDLAGHIAAITGVAIGEHSSTNCPWQNAIEAAEEYKPAQAVDLGPAVIPDTPEVRDILGRPNFWCSPWANVLRMRGDTIPRKAEEEQAAVIRFMLNHYLSHGAAWAETAGAELDAIRKDESKEVAP